jgi:hypothetical protein
MCTFPDADLFAINFSPNVDTMHNWQNHINEMAENLIALLRYLPGT